MKTGTLIISVIFLLLSAGYIYQAQFLPASPATGDVGPAELPVWLGTAGVVLSLMLIVAELRRKTSGKAAQPLTLSWQGAGFLLTVLGFVIAINLIGFVFATFVFTTIGIMILERSVKPVLPVLVGVGAAAFIFLVFEKLLDVPLPTGYMPFG